MENDKKGKYEGKAKHISEKYKFSRFETQSNAELTRLVKELVSELKQNEKIVASLEKSLENKDSEIERLKNKLSVFYGNSDSVEKYIGYDHNWLYVDKICFIIERTRKPINSHQIVELMIKMEPDLKMRLINPFNSITKSLYNAIKLKRLFRYNKTGNFGYTYILPTWLNESGKLEIK